MTNINRAAEIIAEEWGTFSTRDLCGHEIGIARALHRAGMLMPDDMNTQAGPAAPPSTLTVGSEWDDAAALARACDESHRDQIVTLDADGYAFVWSYDAEWWEGSAPPRFDPCTIIHTGFDADQ